MDPVQNVRFVWMIERTGHDHHDPVLQLAAWRDAKGKVTELPVHDLLG